MASPPTTLTRRSTLARRPTLVLLPAIVRLAWWRLKQMWLALLITWLGMIAMVVLICSVPLFTQVSSTAGLRSALTAVPLNQQRVSVNFLSMHPTPDQVNKARQLIDQAVHSNLGPYINGTPHASVTIPSLNVQTVDSAAPTSQNTSLLSITGYELDKVGSELTVVQGRLPATSSDQIEIALTQAEADSLKAKVGSVITAKFPDAVGQVTWTLQVVGIFTPKQNWEYSNSSKKYSDL